MCYDLNFYDIINDIIYKVFILTLKQMRLLTINLYFLTDLTLSDAVTHGV